MPTTYYLDGNTFLNSTSVYTNAAQTVCAPDGFYSDGTNSRELVNCILLPSEVCGDCSTACDESINLPGAAGNQGIYSVNYDLGSATGAVIVTFAPAAVPDGIRVTYDSSVYNTLSSPFDGYHKGTSAELFTYVGSSNPSSDCGISGTTYANIPTYLYNGTAFQNTGTQSITVSPLDVSLSSSPPGNPIMVIPKTSATPSSLSIEIVGPCDDTGWAIIVACAESLPGYSSSTSASGSFPEACNAPLNSTYYNVAVTGTAGVPLLHDYVFSDANGFQALANGWYRTTSGYIEVTNGIVTFVGTCNPEYIYLSSLQDVCSVFCDGTNRAITSQRQTTNNHNYSQIALNDVITPSVLTDGFYAYAATSTDTSTGPFQIMQLENNVVIGLNLCSGASCSPA